MTFSGFAFRITNIDTTSAPEGRMGGYLYEIFGDAENRDMGTQDSTIRTVTKGSKKIKFRLNVVVLPLPVGHFTGLTRKWNITGIEVIDDTFTTTNWNVGENFEDIVSTSAASSGLSIGLLIQLALSMKLLALRLSLRLYITEGETEFESHSQYADIDAVFTEDWCKSPMSQSLSTPLFMSTKYCQTIQRPSTTV